ncbi:hypothetical protein BC629DRAFT_1465692, partial [Irpex lacteus]
GKPRRARSIWERAATPSWTVEGANVTDIIVFEGIGGIGVVALSLSLVLVLFLFSQLGGVGGVLLESFDEDEEVRVVAVDVDVDAEMGTAVGMEGGVDALRTRRMPFRFLMFVEEEDWTRRNRGWGIVIEVEEGVAVLAVVVAVDMDVPRTVFRLPV